MLMQFVCFDQSGGGGIVPCQIISPNQSLTLKINSEQRLVGGHCRQTLLNKARGIFSMAVRLVKWKLILLQTDVNPIRETSSRVINDYFEHFIVGGFPRNRRPWSHDVMRL